MACLVVRRFFAESEAELDRLAAEVEAATRAKAEFEEEHGGDGEGELSGLEGKSGITKGAVIERVMEIRADALAKFPEASAEHAQAKAIKKGSFGVAEWRAGVSDGDGFFASLDVLNEYVRMSDAESRAKAAHKAASDALDAAVMARYPKLTEEEIKALVIEDKWMAAIRRGVKEESDRVARTVAGRVKVLEERYAEPLPDLAAEAESLAERVEEHLDRMGVEWRARV